MPIDLRNNNQSVVFFNPPNKLTINNFELHQVSPSLNQLCNDQNRCIRSERLNGPLIIGGRDYLMPIPGNSIRHSDHRFYMNTGTDSIIRLRRVDSRYHPDRIYSRSRLAIYVTQEDSGPNNWNDFPAMANGITQTEPGQDFRIYDINRTYNLDYAITGGVTSCMVGILYSVDMNTIYLLHIQNRQFSFLNFLRSELNVQNIQPDRWHLFASVYPTDDEVALYPEMTSLNWRSATIFVRGDRLVPNVDSLYNEDVHSWTHVLFGISFLGRDLNPKIIATFEEGSARRPGIFSRISINLSPLFAVQPWMRSLAGNPNALFG